MSSTKTCNYTRQGTVEKFEVVDDFLYDMDRTLSKFMDHWQNHRDDELEEISPETEGQYRHFNVEEDNLYFEITAESDERAVIKLEYRDQQQDPLDHVEGKLEKVWQKRIETVLERGKK
jgi:hemerythrin-like domain-containing protein